MDLIPTERFPAGNDMRPAMYGMERWCDMFTPRQLLGHLTDMETLRDMTPELLERHGRERGAAIVTCLQYMIDKCLDYNSRQTRWEYTRSVIKGTFGRHDFSLKWTFGEMIFTGAHSGLDWGRDQVADAYRGICRLIDPRTVRPALVLNGSAANMDIADQSVDIICVDPPYYNNVQYAELSDYFYVWQKRTLRELYPDVFSRRLTRGRLGVEDLEPEAGAVLTLFGICGLAPFPFDDALSLSKSLNIRLENKAAGYRSEGRMIGINDERSGRGGAAAGGAGPGDRRRAAGAGEGRRQPEIRGSPPPPGGGEGDGPARFTAGRAVLRRGIAARIPRQRAERYDLRSRPGPSP
jgi:hypothetical protein